MVFQIDVANVALVLRCHGVSEGLMMAREKIRICSNERICNPYGENRGHFTLVLRGGVVDAWDRENLKCLESICIERTPISRPT